MALIDFPAGLQISHFSIGLSHPGLILHANPYTGQRLPLLRGPGLWRGSLTLALAGKPTDAQTKRATRFVAQLEGGVNTSDVPLNQPTLATAPSSVTVSSIDSEGGLTLSETLIVTVEAGMFLRLGTRTYLVAAVSAADVLTVEPGGAAAVGDEVGQAQTIRVRQASPQPILSTRITDYVGPWSFEWIEAV